jgi:multiple sugar transport system substrate-binding protein
MKTTRRTFMARSGQATLGMSLASAFGVSFAARAAAQDKVSVEFPYLWAGPEGEAMQAIVDQFNASQDQYEVNGVSNPDAQRQLAAMTSNNGFDVSDNFDANIGTWASKGALEPLDDFIARDSYDTSDFIPAAMEKMSYDGKVYSLPIAVHTSQLMVNDTILSEAGITAPTTHSELAAAIEALTIVDGDTITQLGMGVPDFITFAYTFGGQWINSDLQPTANDPGNIAALQFWVDNVLNKYGVENVQRFQSGFGEYASAQAPFYTGKLAMSIDGEWQARFIQQYAPDLQWSAGPLPVADDQPDLAGTTGLAASTFFIPANAEEKDGAWEFIKYLFSEEPMRDFTIALANLPARTSLLEDEAYTEIPGFSYWLESLKSPNLKSMPNVTWGQEYGTEITSAVDAVMNLSKSPEDALNELQGKAEDLAG